MGRLADQHEPRVADALEERAEIGVVEVVDRLGHLAHELGDGRRAARRAAARRVPLLGLPALGADERHEADVAQVLAREAAVGADA